MKLKNQKNRILFIGSKQFGLKGLKALCRVFGEEIVSVMTIDDSLDTRSVYSDMQRFCNNENIPLYVANNRKDSERFVKELAPDICFVIGWYWLISGDVITSVPGGMIGIHNSLLPKYRGGSPLVWQIINGEEEVGFSIFSFTVGMDEGPIWKQSSLKLLDDAYVSDVLLRIEEVACGFLPDVCQGILSGSLQPQNQDENEATYCAQRRPEDGQIDWSKSDVEIYNFIRAQSHPYPGAFTFMDGEKMIIWRAKLVDITYFGSPGQVGKIDKSGVFIVCGNSRAILLEQVEVNGRKCNAADLIKTVRVRFR